MENSPTTQRPYRSRVSFKGAKLFWFLKVIKVEPNPYRCMLNLFGFIKVFLAGLKARGEIESGKRP